MERKLKALDTRSINIDDDYALEFWMRELNVSRVKLKNAVIAVGMVKIDVKRELNRPNK